MEAAGMEEREKRAFLGTGFHFPLEIDETTGRFRMSSEEENIKESIKLILMTGKGERVMRPEFGCGLKQFVYESMDYGTMGTANRGCGSVRDGGRGKECADDPDRIPGQGNQQPV